jgi:uncharacterized protein involved in exopolysaccharide biosynthesis
VEEAHRQLGVAEDSLRGFLERNRLIASSPGLQFERERLQRVTNLREEVLLTLQRGLESTRVQEVNETPVLTVIDRPAVPTRPKQPGVLLMCLLGGMLGAVTGAGWVLVSDAWQSRELAEGRTQAPGSSDSGADGYTSDRAPSTSVA